MCDTIVEKKCRPSSPTIDKRRGGQLDANPNQNRKTSAIFENHHWKGHSSGATQRLRQNAKAKQLTRRLPYSLEADTFSPPPHPLLFFFFDARLHLSSC
jgi:hypothetical protein